MKITKIKISEAKDSNPFINAQWREASIEEKATIYSKLANIQNARV